MKIDMHGIVKHNMSVQQVQKLKELFQTFRENLTDDESRFFSVELEKIGHLIDASIAWEKEPMSQQYVMYLVIKVLKLRQFNDFDRFLFRHITENEVQRFLKFHFTHLFEREEKLDLKRSIENVDREKINKALRNVMLGGMKNLGQDENELLQQFSDETLITQLFAIYVEHISYLTNPTYNNNIPSDTGFPFQLKNTESYYTDLLYKAG